VFINNNSQITENDSVKTQSVRELFTLDLG
jgi:hypothetical protein